MSKRWDNLTSVGQLQGEPESGMNFPLWATSVSQCSMRAWRKRRAASPENGLLESPSIKHLFPQQTAAGSWGTEKKQGFRPGIYRSMFLTYVFQSEAKQIHVFLSHKLPLFPLSESPNLSGSLLSEISDCSPASQRKAELLQTSSLGKECSRGDLDTWLPGTVSRGELKEAGIVPYFNIIALWLLWESIHWPSDRASHSVSKREACDLGDRYDILMRERWVLMGEEEEPSGVSQGQGSECGMWWQVTTQFSHSEMTLRRTTWPFWTLASQSFSIKPSRMIPMRKHLCELLYT